MTGAYRFMPDYHSRTGAQVGRPPFLFQGVTMRILPLRASLGRLQAFIDLYLNMNIPQDMLHFRVSTPHVFFSLLNYGRMSSQASDAGWVSQNELLFMIMLDRCRLVSGRLVQDDMVTVCPFIFVDSAASQVVGQEVYGWPKVQFSIAPSIAPWSQSPVERTSLSQLRTLAYPAGGIGGWVQDRIMIEIEMDSTSVAAQFPPDPFGRSGITGVVGRYAQNAASLWTSLFSPWLPMSGDPRGTAVGLWTQLPRLIELLSEPSALAESAFFNCVNLKQFRDAGTLRSSMPFTVQESGLDFACYQAIVNGRMKVRQVNRLGLLGDMHYLLGDPSGGCSIKLHHLPNLPVVEMFGLEVEGEETLPVEGEPPRKVSRLQPLFPFWCDVDLDYEVGKVLCWRTRSSDWLGLGLPASAGTTKPAQGAADSPPPRNRYNTARGAAVQALRLPFRLDNTSVHVLPLVADPNRFADLVKPLTALARSHPARPPWAPRHPMRQGHCSIEESR